MHCNAAYFCPHFFFVALGVWMDIIGMDIAMDKGSIRWILLLAVQQKKHTECEGETSHSLSGAGTN